jgi:LPXTG-site transpeptidase (sortase) family protein
MAKKINSKMTSTKKANNVSPISTSGLILIIIGLLIAGFSLLGIWWSQRSSEKPKPFNQVVNNAKPHDDGTPLITGTPTHIEIPNVGIDLNVIPGYYYPKTATWTLSLDSAQFATMTAKPNNKSGDTFIYAHYRFHVFYTLPKVKAGDEAIITTDNGHTFRYTFVSSTITTPDNTSLFNYKGKPILILQTCTGTHFQNRQLFVFNFTQVN